MKRRREPGEAEPPGEALAEAVARGAGGMTDGDDQPGRVGGEAAGAKRVRVVKDDAGSSWEEQESYVLLKIPPGVDGAGALSTAPSASAARASKAPRGADVASLPVLSLWGLDSERPVLRFGQQVLYGRLERGFGTTVAIRETRGPPPQHGTALERAMPSVALGTPFEVDHVIDFTLVSLTVDGEALPPPPKPPKRRRRRRRGDALVEPEEDE